MIMVLLVSLSLTQCSTSVGVPSPSSCFPFKDVYIMYMSIVHLLMVCASVMCIVVCGVCGPQDTVRGGQDGQFGL